MSCHEAYQGNLQFGYKSCNDGWLLNGKVNLPLCSLSYETGDIIKENGEVIGVMVSTNLVIAMTDEGKKALDAAVAKCKVKTIGGKSWRLPTKDELMAMKNVYEVVFATLSQNGGRGMSRYYWSSTEYSSTHALRVSPCDSGGYVAPPKTYSDGVRCVFDL